MQTTHTDHVLVVSYLNVSETSLVTMTTRQRVVPVFRSEWPRTRAPIA